MTETINNHNDWQNYCELVNSQYNVTGSVTFSRIVHNPYGRHIAVFLDGRTQGYLVQVEGFGWEVEDAKYSELSLEKSVEGKFDGSNSVRARASVRLALGDNPYKDPSYMGELD